MLVSSVTARTCGGSIPSSAARSFGRVDRGAHHVETAQRVHVDDVHVGRTSCAIAARDRARNIVQFRVDEHANVARFAVGEDALRIAAERLQTDLDDDVELVESVDELFGPFRVRNVERDDQLSHVTGS